jgi:hypothetical protein
MYWYFCYELIYLWFTLTIYLKKLISVSSSAFISFIQNFGRLAIFLWNPDFYTFLSVIFNS